MHITRATLDYLGDKFEVEPGGGAGRESYLADHKVETFLIVPPKVSEKERLSIRIAPLPEMETDSENARKRQIDKQTPSPAGLIESDFPR